MSTLDARLRAIVEALPADASVTLPLAVLASWLAESEPASTTVDTDPAASWRTTIWTVPAETRIGVAELAEAVGKSRAWIYRRTSQNGARHGYGAQPDRIPHRKVGGELQFVASEIREWLRARERAA